MPRCWTHSPTAYTSGSLVRSWSSTTIARSQSRPHSLAEFLVRPDARGDDDHVGRDLGAVREPHAGDLACARRSSSCWSPVRTLMPSCSIVCRSTLPPASSSCTPISHGAISTTVTSRLCVISPLAASSPSSPPPMTTAVLHCLGVLGDVAAVVERAEDEDAVQRRPRDRRDERPRAGGDHEPVVRHRRRRRRKRPSRSRSMRVTRWPACRVTPFSSYQSSGLRKISFGVLRCR